MFKVLAVCVVASLFTVFMMCANSLSWPRHANGYKHSKQGWPFTFRTESLNFVTREKHFWKSDLALCENLVVWLVGVHFCYWAYRRSLRGVTPTPNIEKDSV
jgi:hypothetical protein